MQASLIQEIHKSILDFHPTPRLMSFLENEVSSFEECEVIDFKQQLPDNDTEYAKTIADLVAFHNSYGGILVFGVKEIKENRTFEVCGIADARLKQEKVKQFIKNYTNHDIRLSFPQLNHRGTPIQLIMIAKRGENQKPVQFVKNGPEIKPKELVFKKETVKFRRIDDNALATKPEDFEFLFSQRHPPSLELEANSFSNAKVIENNLPDRDLICPKFIGRDDDISKLWEWLSDGFSHVKLVASGGGFGKTSLAYHFSEKLAKNIGTGFIKIVWLSAKERQFIPIKNQYSRIPRIDYGDPSSLYHQIIINLGGIESELAELTEIKDLQKKALQACCELQAFIIIDDIDSLPKDDQRRILEFGLQISGDTKILITTRINYSYSTDNTLTLQGLNIADYKEYIASKRSNFKLSTLTEGKISHLHSVTSGSPLFTDSLFRLEQRGLPLDKAIASWRDKEGIDVRKAALEREIQQLSHHAKRVLYTIAQLKNCSHDELISIFQELAAQTLSDALQELSDLFLVQTPSFSDGKRYTIDNNIQKLVDEMESSLKIDHIALSTRITSSQSDAISIAKSRREQIVGQAIAEANAKIKSNNAAGALSTVQAASKRLKKPDMDLLLSEGRCHLNLSFPDFKKACDCFSESYSLGQRKKILFDWWFDAEISRSDYSKAIDVADKALHHGISDIEWFEKRARARFQEATRGSSLQLNFDSVERAIALTVADLHQARKMTSSIAEKQRITRTIEAAHDFINRLN